jgi:hypothetical protein
MRIKIVQKGWENFSGSMGTLVFKDGMAQTTDIEARRIGSLIKVVECDENGFEFDTVSDAHTMAMTRRMSATVVEPLKTGEDEQPAPAPEATTDEQSEEDAAPAAPPPPPAEPEYDRAKLEEIASASGIKGLRAIGDKLNARGTSVVGLIDAILKAQSSKPQG